jgi:hypothetical protein
MFTDLVLDLALPVLKTLAAKIPASIEMDITKQSYITSTLTFMKIINKTQELFIKSLFQDGVAVILACLFIFTPFHVVGVVVVACCFPLSSPRWCWAEAQGCRCREVECFCFIQLEGEV